MRRLPSRYYRFRGWDPQRPRVHHLLSPELKVRADFSLRMEQWGRESEVWYFCHGQFRSVSSQFGLNVNANPGEENGLGTSAGTASRHERFTRSRRGVAAERQPHRRCLTVRRVQTESGTPLVLYDCAERQDANLTGQYWHFLPACEDKDGPPGVYKVCPSVSCPNTNAGLRCWRVCGLPPERLLRWAPVQDVSQHSRV